MEDSCSCPCHKMLGILIILLGLVFLLESLAVLSPYIVSMAWPVLVMLIGLKLITKGVCKCCDKS